MIESPEISTEDPLTYREFVAGHKLAARQSIPMLVFRLFARFFASTIAILLIFLAVVHLSNGHASTVLPVLPLIFMVLLVPSIIWISWRYSLRQLQWIKGQDPKVIFQVSSTSCGRELAGMGAIN